MHSERSHFDQIHYARLDFDTCSALSDGVHTLTP